MNAIALSKQHRFFINVVNFNSPVSNTFRISHQKLKKNKTFTISSNVKLYKQFICAPDHSTCYIQ